MRVIKLRDGRRAAVHVTEGASGGRTVVFCHSAPGAGAFDPDRDATAARGATLIGVDRPGYGGADPMPDTSWADIGTVADDLAEILDQMGTGPVGLAGWVGRRPCRTRRRGAAPRPHGPRRGRRDSGT